MEKMSRKGKLLSDLNEMYCEEQNPGDNYTAVAVIIEITLIFIICVLGTSVIQSHKSVS